MDRDDPPIVTAALDLLMAIGSSAAEPVVNFLIQTDPRPRGRAPWLLKSVTHPQLRLRVLQAARPASGPLVRAYVPETLHPWAGGDQVRAVPVAGLERQVKRVLRPGAARAAPPEGIARRHARALLWGLEEAGK